MKSDTRKKIAAGVAAAAMVAGGVFCLGDGELANRFFLYSGAPFYVSAGKAADDALKPEAGEGDIAVLAFSDSTAGNGVNAPIDQPSAIAAPIESGVAVVGVESLVYQSDHDSAPTFDTAVLPYSLDQLRDFNFLRKNFYTINPDTDLLAADIDIDTALATDFRLSKTQGAAQILIFHTHMYESFAGSDETDYTKGVYAAGERLAADLRARGIGVLHLDERADIVDGSVSVLGAYERMEAIVKRVLAENPTIEMCIDLHRDGVTTTAPAVAVVNGRRAARVMLFNGLSRIKTNDKLSPISGLDNPNRYTNLALSLRLLLTSESYYPGLAKKIYLKPYRYSLHMMPKSILVEIGNQNNTLDEAIYAMDLLADVIYGVVGD